jgi:hypothetical protein
MKRHIAEDGHASWRNPTPDDLFGDLSSRYKRYYQHFNITS